jgi:hypothetical protein
MSLAFVMLRASKITLVALGNDSLMLPKRFHEVLQI